MIRRLLGWVMLLTLSACSPITLLNALGQSAGKTETHAIPYAQGDRHQLDIYAPRAQTSGPQPNAPQPSAPVVVFLYGGGWKTGERANYRFVATALAARGYLTVVPDYRLFPQVRFPAFLRDNAAAIAWTKANIARYGGNPTRIFLMGHSAGAYNAAMLTLDTQWLGAEGLNPDRDIAGTIALSGPYDFLPFNDPELGEIFAPAGDLRLSQPITFARGNAPPMFLASGTADQTVRPRNTQHLADAIRQAGGTVQQRLYPGISHVQVIGAVAPVLRWLAPVTADVTAFLEQHNHQPETISQPGTIRGN